MLRDSDKSDHRALAAQVLGYATDKASVVGDLSSAMRDTDADVRNNATRALWVIATFAQKAPDRKIQVPADPFVDLLNSLTWTDRNKSSLALMSLDRATGSSAARDPSAESRACADRDGALEEPRPRCRFRHDPGSGSGNP